MQDKFKTHKMYAKTGDVKTVKTVKEHNALVKKGYSKTRK